MLCAGIISSKIKPCPVPFFNHFTQNGTFPFANQNLYLHIFSNFISNIFLYVLSLSLKQIKYQATAFFEFIQYVYEIFQNLKQRLQNHSAKNI